MQHLPHPRKIPSLVYADAEGRIKDLPDLAMAGRSGSWFSLPEPEDLIPLPEGSELFVLPDRNPVGIDPGTSSPCLVDCDPDSPNSKAFAVAAFMAPAHTALFTAAFEKTAPDIPHLPLFAYTAVGWLDGEFWVAGFRSDADTRQEFSGISPNTLRTKTTRVLKEYKANRLIQHLGKCCLTYGCPAAKNFFLGKFEAPLPTSPICNAECVGCISLQPSGCCPATQDRIKFVPTPSEIAEIAVKHLAAAPHGVASFGQGCEGEPLLQAATIENAIQLIRKKTSAGTINLNTNASLPDKVEQLAAMGLDSIRVSMNSARKAFHKRYYNPKGFDLIDALESVTHMKINKKFASLNYFILPGFTDDPEEFEALCKVIENHRPDMIQLRNLNMDPDWYFEVIEHRPDHKPLGMRNWLSLLRNRFPNLRLGYFNPALR